MDVVTYALLKKKIKNTSNKSLNRQGLFEVLEPLGLLEDYTYLVDENDLILMDKDGQILIYDVYDIKQVADNLIIPGGAKISDEIQQLGDILRIGLPQI